MRDVIDWNERILLGTMPYITWEDHAILNGNTWALMRFTQVDTAPGLGYGYYVVCINGEHPYESGKGFERNNFTVRSGKFFVDDDREYCNTNAGRVAQEYLNRIRNANSITVE